MSTVLWALAGWVGLSILLVLAFAIGAGIGYRRGQEDARAAGTPTIRIDEHEPIQQRQHAQTRVS